MLLNGKVRGESLPIVYATTIDENLNLSYSVECFTWSKSTVVNKSWSVRTLQHCDATVALTIIIYACLLQKAYRTVYTVQNKDAFDNFENRSYFEWCMFFFCLREQNKNNNKKHCVHLVFVYKNGLLFYLIILKLIRLFF